MVMQVVIAPHGPALSYIVFCAPGTRVVEFVPLKDPAPLMFWHLAAGNRAIIIITNIYTCNNNYD
jgi:capsular polysaccharide biosynthesis protein